MLNLPSFYNKRQKDHHGKDFLNIKPFLKRGISPKRIFSQMELHFKKGEKSRVDSLKTTPGKHYSAVKKLELEMATRVYLFLTIKVLFLIVYYHLLISRVKSFFFHVRTAVGGKEKSLCADDLISRYIIIIDIKTIIIIKERRQKFRFIS